MCVLKKIQKLKKKTERDIYRERKRLNKLNRLLRRHTPLVSSEKHSCVLLFYWPIVEDITYKAFDLAFPHKPIMSSAEVSACY